MIKFDVVTLFPQLFTEHFANLPFKRAVEKNIAQYNLWNLRDFAVDKRGTVDDKTYGGGVGMILMVEPIYKALEAIYGKGKIPEKSSKKQRVVVLTPAGESFTQQKAKEFSEYDQITLLCGRYEGMDARIEENIATDRISVGNFVLSGGELPALSIMESVTRLLPGVLEKENVTKIESFSNGNIEYPQYTRPEDFRGMKVPNILVNGNHKEIEKWRQSKSKKMLKLPRSLPQSL
jgi:tRNA (guanine37-N1)-methyltransferase